jgi:tetratricopeptide (TPR) repeat protein
MRLPWKTTLAAALLALASPALLAAPASRKSPDLHDARERAFDFASFRDLLHAAIAAGEDAPLTGRIERAAEAGDAEALLLAGHLARIGGRPEEAVEHYREAGRKASRKAPALRVLARYLVRAGRHEEALEVFEEAISFGGDKDLRWDLVTEGVQVAARLGEVERVRSFFVGALRARLRGPHTIRAEEARALGAAGADGLAVEVWRKLLDERGLRDDLRDLAVRELGELLERGGRSDEALELYWGTLRALPRDHWMRAELLDRVVEAHRRAGRIEELLSSLKRYARGYEALYARARVLEDLGRMPEAVAAYEKILKRYRYAPAPYERLARLLRLGGDLPGVVKLLRARMRAMPGDVKVVFELARVYDELGRPRDAVKLLADTESRFRHDPAVVAEVTDLLVRLEAKPKVVLRAFARLRVLEPAEPEHIEALGAYLYGLHRLDEAKKTWRKLMEAAVVRRIAGAEKGKVAEARARVRLARVLRDHHFDEDAQRAYEQALELAPRDPDVIAAVAGWYERARRPKRAVRLWERIVELDPDLTSDQTESAIERIVTLLAEEGVLAGRVEGDAPAGAFAGSGLRGDWPGVSGAVVRVTALARLGRTKEALAAGEKAAAAHGDPPALLRALLGVARDSGRNESVLSLLHRLRAKRPSEASALLLERAEVLLRLDREPEARRALDEVVALAPGEVTVLRRIAKLQERLGEVRAAARTLERAVDDHPDEAPLAFALAELLRRLGEQDRERRALERVVRIASQPLEVQRAGKRLIRLARTEGHLDALDRMLGPILARAGDPDAARSLWLDVRVRRLRLRQVDELLGRTGPEAGLSAPSVGRLSEALVSGDANARAKALEALAADTPEGVALLLEPLLDDPDVEIRLATLRALGSRPDEKTLEVLWKHVLDPGRQSQVDESTLLGAIWVLGRVPLSVEIPWERLAPPSVAARASEGLVLASSVRGDRDALPLIERALESSVPGQRAAAYFALARLRGGAPEELAAVALGALPAEQGVARLAARYLALSLGAEKSAGTIARALVAGGGDLMEDLLALMGPAPVRSEEDVASETGRLWKRSLRVRSAKVGFSAFMRAALASEMSSRLASSVSGESLNGARTGKVVGDALRDALSGLPAPRRRRKLRSLALRSDDLRLRLAGPAAAAHCLGLAKAIEDTRPGEATLGEQVSVLALTGDCVDATSPARLSRPLARAPSTLRAPILKRLAAREEALSVAALDALRPSAGDAGLAILWLSLADRAGVAAPDSVLAAWLSPGAEDLALAALAHAASRSDAPIGAELLDAIEVVARSEDARLRQGALRLLCRRPLPAGRPLPPWIAEIWDDPRSEIREAREGCHSLQARLATAKEAP